MTHETTIGHAIATALRTLVYLTFPRTCATHGGRLAHGQACPRCGSDDTMIAGPDGPVWFAEDLYGAILDRLDLDPLLWCEDSEAGMDAYAADVNDRTGETVTICGVEYGIGDLSLQVDPVAFEMDRDAERDADASEGAIVSLDGIRWYDAAALADALIEALDESPTAPGDDAIDALTAALC